MLKKERERETFQAAGKTTHHPVTWYMF